MGKWEKSRKRWNVEEAKRKKEARKTMEAEVQARTQRELLLDRWVFLFRNLPAITRIDLAESPGSTVRSPTIHGHSWEKVQLWLNLHSYLSGWRAETFVEIKDGKEIFLKSFSSSSHSHQLRATLIGRETLVNLQLYLPPWVMERLSGWPSAFLAPSSPHFLLFNRSALSNTLFNRILFLSWELLTTGEAGVLMLSLTFLFRVYEKQIVMLFQLSRFNFSFDPNINIENKINQTARKLFNFSLGYSGDVRDIKLVPAPYTFC